jgi:hypothetical protein
MLAFRGRCTGTQKLIETKTRTLKPQMHPTLFRPRT